MSEAVPIDPRTMALDQTVTIFEQLLLERTLEDLAAGKDPAEITLSGLSAAYNQALRDRYPFKKI